MNITIKINTENDAFQNGMLRFEVAQILDDLSREVNDFGIVSKPIRDVNGNICGSVKVTK